MDVNGQLKLDNVLPATDGESDLIVRGEDGVLKKLTLAEMADAPFLPRLCFEGSQPVWSGEYVPAQGDEMGYGKLYTGCADRVGILTNTPLHPLDVNGHAQFRSSVSVNHRLSVGTEISNFARFMVKNLSGGAAIQVDQKDNTNPYAKLLFLEYTEPTTEIIHVSGPDGHVPLLIDAAGNFRLANSNKTIMYMNASEETFYTRRIIVDQETWPDYVFEQNYKLLTLYEVKDYISNNGHLPGVPSREKVLENGTDLGEINRVLLEKIEELMLYSIGQQEEIDKLKGQVTELLNK